MLVAVLLLLATCPAARGDDLSSAAGVAGDCGASPCADLVAASASTAPGALVFKFDGMSPWGLGYTPLLRHNPRRRAAAYRHRRIDVPFRVPAGHGRVTMAVRPSAVRRPPRASVFGGRSCRAGRPCIVHLKLEPKGVRAYASRPLALTLTFFTGSHRRRVQTALGTPVRMPLPRG